MKKKNKREKEKIDSFDRIVLLSALAFAIIGIIKMFQGSGMLGIWMFLCSFWMIFAIGNKFLKEKAQEERDKVFELLDKSIELTKRMEGMMDKTKNCFEELVNGLSEAAEKTKETPKVKDEFKKNK